MKGSQKRWQPKNTDSVIAMLMDFDELPPQRPVHDKCRVLSETYIHKVASISLRPRSLVSFGRWCSTNDEIVDGVKCVSRVRISKSKDGNVLDTCVDSSSSNARSSVRRLKPAGASVSKTFSTKSEHCATSRVLRLQQKLEHDSLARHLGVLGIDFASNSLNFPLEMKDKPHLFSSSASGIRPNSATVAHDLSDVKFDIHSRPGYRELGKSLMPEIGKPQNEFTYKELVVNGFVSPRHSCVACIQAMSKISPPERCRSKFEELLKVEYKDYSHQPHLLLDQSSLANKSRKKNFRGWKTAKKVQEFGVSGGNQTLNQILALTDKKSMARNLNMRPCTNDLGSPSSLQSRSSGSSSPSVFIKSEVQTTSRKDILESKRNASVQFQDSVGADKTIPPSSKVSDLSSSDLSCFDSSYNSREAHIQGMWDGIDNCSENDRCKEVVPILRNPKSISKLASQHLHDASYDIEEAFNAEVCTRINDDPLSKSDPVFLLEEGVHSSNVEEVFSSEASVNEFSEEESAYSKCSGIGHLVSPENLKRTNQHSPDSVLESRDMKNPPPFECFDSIGLMLQLQALDLESEETRSEGSAIIVSGDEDFEELFGDLSNEGRKVKRWLGEEESRDFSYLVDVLDEAGFYDINSFMDFNKWTSLECPISLLVFDALEKKYGKQTSWKKSERQLLFDRINSGLLEIYDPIINFHAGAISICKRFCASFRRDEVEEELWMTLTSQENKKSKDLSEKALDKWLEFNEGISIICGELETSIFNELVMELTSS